MNELLLAAQQREAGKSADQPPLDLHDQIVLARTPANPLSPPDVFAATLATILGNRYVHRVSPIFDYVVLLLVAAAAGSIHRFNRLDLVLWGIAFSAAYCLVALAALSRWSIWLPGLLPLGAIWLAIMAAFCFRTPAEQATDATITIPPPVA